jgi:hypothetical protein
MGMPSYAMDVVVNVPSFPVESTAKMLLYSVPDVIKNI